VPSAFKIPGSSGSCPICNGLGSNVRPLRRVLSVTENARRSNDDYTPPVDNSSSDEMVRRQQDQDNLQQMLNTQQMINDQQMQNDQMFQQQQQQMINDMNNR
jgi:excinuclease UvrABC ATPase subunit